MHSSLCLRVKENVFLFLKMGGGVGRVHTFLFIEVTYKAHGNNGIKFPPFLKLYTFIKVAINVITT